MEMLLYTECWMTSIMEFCAFVYIGVFFSVIQDDGTEVEMVEGFINSATIRGQIWPRVIVPLESCDILVNSTIFSSLCYKIDFLFQRQL